MRFLPALAVFTGTIIGAGFLGIPYVVSKSGVLFGFFYLLMVALFIMLIKLYLGEVTLRTSGSHQLTGYAEKYLGKKGKIVMFLAMIFGIFPALLAYLLAEGRSLSYVFFGNFDYSFYFSLGFWLLMTCLTFVGLRALKRYDKLGLFLVLGIVLSIFIFFIGDVKTENFSLIGENIFSPFGVILFSFLAFSSLREVRRILFGEGKLMKEVIISGVMIAFLVYLLFCFIVVGVFGTSVQEIATLSLGRFFSILGVLTMFTAFFTQSLAMRDMFRFDFGLGRMKGWILASIIPLILFLITYFFDGLSFTQILGIAGVISGGLTGILILLMNLKSKRKGDRRPEYSIRINLEIILILSLLFILGVLLELFL